MFRSCLKIFISVIFAQLFNIGCMNSTIFHMNLINWLIFLVKLCCVEKLDCEKVGNNSYFFIFFAILFQKFLDFSSSFSDICGSLSEMLIVHKLWYLCSLFLVFDALEMDFFKKFEVFLLVFKRIVFDEPKLTLSFNFWKIKLFELTFLDFNTSTNLRAMFKGLAQQGFNDMRTFPFRKDNSWCFKSSLKRRTDNQVWIEVFQLFFGLQALWIAKVVPVIFREEKDGNQ